MHPEQNRRIAIACFSLICIGCCAQLFARPQTGIANNGDFSKVAGYYGLAPTVGWRVDEVEYFITEYSFADQNRWKSGLFSSEHVFVWVAVKLNRLFISKQFFSIHVLTAVHLTFYLAICAILLRLLSRLSWLPMVLAALVLTDLPFVAYFPTFYMDTAAMLFLLAFLTSLLAYHLRPPFRISATIATLVFGVLLVLSKSQHALLALPLAIFAIYEAWRSRRWIWIASAILFLGASGYMLTTPTTGYRASALFSMIFYKIGRSSPDATKEFAELGLGKEYVRYQGLHAYSPQAPVENPQWQVEFLQTTSWARLAEFYAHHPGRALSFITSDLVEFGYSHPDAGLGIRRRQDKSFGRGFYIWRYARNLSMKYFPAQVLILLLAGLFTPKLPGKSILLVFTAMCTIALVLSGLADCLETARHLYLFQVLCDLLIVYWICLLSSKSGNVLARLLR